MGSEEALAGRVALVTGGGRGIGRAAALALARAGMAVAVAGRTRGRLETVARELAEAAPRALAQEMDVTDPESVAAGLGRIRERLGPVDVLVNNAGVAESAPLVRTDLALWWRHLDVNATGAFLLTRAVLPGMLERGWGRVVNIASTAGLAGAPYIAAYAASKHALVGLTRAVAAETSGTGVTVNAVCPGYVASDMTWEGARRISEKTGRPFADAVRAMAAFNPSGRLVTPEEVAAAVVALVENGQRSGETVVLQ
jgi:NAD(P)-dependent dehydrogenase (short-subunit alcohol dehydrogenase family)